MSYIVRYPFLAAFFSPWKQADEEGGGVGGDGVGAEKPDAADQGAYDFGCDLV